MKYIESITSELKLTLDDKMKAEIVAFLNSYIGGTIYVGVNDDGTIANISNEEKDKNESMVINWIRDESIYPNCSEFVTISYNDDNVLQIDILPGNKKPYYLKDKGLKPSGVYIRYGRNKSQATPEEIQRMIVESKSIGFELYESYEQELTFKALQNKFDDLNLDFSKFKMVTSGFINPKTNKYTNLAFWFSDQYDIETKVAVYQGNDRSVFKSKKEFSGSIIKQIDNVTEYFDICNINKVEIDNNRKRHEYPSYYKKAILEALYNCYCHRDYQINSNIKMEFFDDRCEIISPGGFYDGLTLDAALSGVQSFRNKKLVILLNKLGYIENYASGLGRIFSEYKNETNKPFFNTSRISFKVTFPNMNTVSETIDIKKEHSNKDLTEQEKIIMDFLSTHDSIRRITVEDLLNIKSSRAKELLTLMCQKGLIKIVGTGPTSRYIKCD